MLKTIASTIAATAFLATAAFAAEIEGTVTTFDPVTGIITLDSGEVFAVPAGVLDMPLEAGTKVKIVYAEGTTDVEEITLM